MMPRNPSGSVSGQKDERKKVEVKKKIAKTFSGVSGKSLSLNYDQNHFV